MPAEAFLGAHTAAMDAPKPVEHSPRMGRAPASRLNEPDLLAFAAELGIEPDDELLPEAMRVPLSLAWRECWDERGEKFYHSPALGRSSWSHPRRDAFLQRYIALKVARELDEAARPHIVACLDRITTGSAVQGESEKLLAFGAQAAQLAANIDVDTADAGPAFSATLLQVCQTLLQPLMDDMSQLRPALHRAAAENEDLARRLESRRVQLEVVEQRQRSIKARLRERQQAATCVTPHNHRRPIGRRPWPIGTLATAAEDTVPPATAGPGVAPDEPIAAQLSLSKALLLFPDPTSPSSLSEWLRGEDTDPADSSVCTGSWTLLATTESDSRSAPSNEEQAAAASGAARVRWAGTNTWNKDVE